MNNSDNNMKIYMESCNLISQWTGALATPECPAQRRSSPPGWPRRVAKVSKRKTGALPWLTSACGPIRAESSMSLGPLTQWSTLLAVGICRICRDVRTFSPCPSLLEPLHLLLPLLMLVCGSHRKNPHM